MHKIIKHMPKCNTGDILVCNKSDILERAYIDI